MIGPTRRVGNRGHVIFNYGGLTPLSTSYYCLYASGINWWRCHTTWSYKKHGFCRPPRSCQGWKFSNSSLQSLQRLLWLFLLGVVLLYLFLVSCWRASCDLLSVAWSTWGSRGRFYIYLTSPVNKYTLQHWLYLLPHIGTRLTACKHFEIIASYFRSKRGLTPWLGPGV